MSSVHGALHGRYSSIRPAGAWLIKTVWMPSQASADVQAPVLELRRRETVLYYNRLEEAGVAMPETVIDLAVTRPGEGQPFFQMRCRRIDRPSAVLTLATAPVAVKGQAVAAIFSQMMKVAATADGDRPVGYDSGLDNFVIGQDGICRLIDIYPPRLGYHPETGVRLEGDLLRINFDEMRNQTAEREQQMRWYYYDPRGMVEHLLTWAIAAAHGDGDAVRQWSSTETNPTESDRLAAGEKIWSLCHDGPETHIVISAAAESLRSGGRADLAEHMANYLQTSAMKHELDHRLGQIADRVKKARSAWLDMSSSIGSPQIGTNP